MHFCSNVVTGLDGQGSAVLLRAAEPLEGIDAMRRLRGVDDVRLLCSGPARLCQALDITRAENGLDLVEGDALRILEGVPVPPEAVRVTTRVGIASGVERPWRFLVDGDRFVSPGRPAGDRLRGSRRS
jgi:DNA-3-methyladenine glycosylase